MPRGPGARPRRGEHPMRDRRARERRRPVHDSAVRKRQQKITARLRMKKMPLAKTSDRQPAEPRAVLGRKD
jgi:hypothetical protein